MRKALLTGLTTISLLGGGMAVALPAHAAATLVVDSDGMGSAGDCNSSTPTYMTIMAAVADANDGDTIVVCPGTYDENVTTSKSLTFQGAKAGVDARTRSTTGETTVDGGGGTAFSLSGPNSVIDGFTIVGATGNPGQPTPAVFVNGNGQTVQNDIFDGNLAAAIIVADSATFTQNKVTAVSTADGGGYGFFFNSNTGSGSTVTDNAFDGQLDGAAINVADPTPLNGLTITGNTADTSTSGNFAVLGGTRNVTISENVVTGSSSSGTGILFLGDDAGYSVTKNVVTGLGTASAVSFANYGYAANGGGTISQNAFKNNVRGINVTDMDGAAKLVANLNILVGNTSGGTDTSPNAAIRNTTTATVSAQNNFYGCQTGPNTAGCDATLNTGGGILDDDPWLVLSTTVGATSIPQGGTTSFTADLNHNSDGNVVSGSVLDGVETAAFSFSKGSVNPASAPIVERQRTDDPDRCGDRQGHGLGSGGERDQHQDGDRDRSEAARAHHPRRGPGRGRLRDAPAGLHGHDEQGLVARGLRAVHHGERLGQGRVGLRREERDADDPGRQEVRDRSASRSSATGRRSRTSCSP